MFDDPIRAITITAPPPHFRISSIRHVSVPRDRSRDRSDGSNKRKNYRYYSSLFSLALSELSANHKPLLKQTCPRSGVRSSNPGTESGGRGPHPGHWNDACDRRRLLGGCADQQWYVYHHHHHHHCRCCHPLRSVSIDPRSRAVLGNRPYPYRALEMATQRDDNMADGLVG